jgi:hypothetical protein
MATKTKATAKEERLTLGDLESIRLALMHTRVYLRNPGDDQANKMLDKTQAKIERIILGRGHRLQKV